MRVTPRRKPKRFKDTVRLDRTSVLLHKYTQTRVMQLSLRQSDCIYRGRLSDVYLCATYPIFEKMIFAKVSFITLLILNKVRAQRGANDFGRGKKALSRRVL